MPKIINLLPPKLPKEIQTEMRESTHDSKITQILNHLQVCTIKQIFDIIDTNSKKHFKKPFHVLELGCFQMYGLAPFLDNGYYCTGVDIVRHALEVDDFVNPNHHRLTRILAIMERLEIEPDSHHGVFIQAALHHSYDVTSVCTHVHSILKKNGVFIIANEPYEAFFERKDPRMENFIVQGHNDHLYPLKTYFSALKKSGFKDIKVIIPDYFFNMKPLKKNEVRPYKYYLSLVLTPFLKTKLGKILFTIVYHNIYKLIDLPMIIHAKK